MAICLAPYGKYNFITKSEIGAAKARQTVIMQKSMTHPLVGAVVNFKQLQNNKLIQFTQQESTLKCETL